MDRNLLPISAFPAWAKLNNIELNGVVVSTLQGSKGSGVVATQDLSEDNAILMTVPQELLLSIDSVWTIAKSDRHLRAVLEAVGDYARVQQTLLCSAINIRFGMLMRARQPEELS